uniref:Zinc finger protein jing n=1 Tax=Globodera pallida TaxID=36090 RepID=A0A183BJ56_GLOPA
MSQLLLDELFDEEFDGQNGTSKLASSSLNQSSASTTELISDKTTSFGDEKSAKSSSFFYATSSTPSLSELNTSTTLLCRSGEKKRGARHFSADVLPLLKKKQASGTHSPLVAGSTSTAAASAAAATAAGRSCTVYYDALAEHLLEDNNSNAVQQQIDFDNAKCVLNPVFCTEEEEEEKRWTKTKSEHFGDQTEGDEDANCCDNTGEGAGSLESLIKEPKRSTANNALAAEKIGARHFSADVLPLLKKKQASGTHSPLVAGSTPTASAAAATAAGRSCTVYYDALAEHLLEDNNSNAVQQQIDFDNSKCVLNPVFCTEEEEEEKRWTKTKSEHFGDQTEGDEDANCCDNRGEGAGSLESLIKEPKRSTANNALAAEKPHQHQPHSPSSPPALLLLSSKSSSSGNIRKRQPSSREQKQQHQQQKQRGPMRILGSSGSGSGSASGGGMVSKAKASGIGGTSVAPMSMPISDGPAAPSSTAAVGVATGGGKRVIQAKHNQ